MVHVPNPVRLTLLGVGLGLARLGLVDEHRARRVVDLAWPRVVTGLARMSRTTADIAMIGVSVGSAAIAGVGFAAPYSAAAFTIGGGFAAGTIALVSQRYGADAYDELGQAVRSSVVLVLAVLVPIAVIYWTASTPLIGLLSSDPEATRLGATYLRLIALAIPFAGLNLLGSRALVGADDAWTAMVLRSGGAIANIALNAVLIFGLDMGVAGAAIGSVISTVAVTLAFVAGITTGRLPGVGKFPVSVAPGGDYLDAETMRNVVEIGLPAIGRNMVLTVARFPMLAFVGLFGAPVVAAYVISWRIARLMNTPGWGFGLAASSLVGQSLGEDDEASAEAFCREIVRIAVATYVIAAALVFAFARPIVVVFVDDPTSRTVDVAVPLVYAACIAVVAMGVTSSVSGALDATGDNRWPFYSRAVGMFGLALPLTYLGATTSLGLWGLYLAYFGQTFVPALVNYYRFSTGKWKAISREYRPEAATGDD